MPIHKRIQEPLKSFSDYSESTSTPEKHAAVYFTDANYQPLSVNKTKIASTETQTAYKNHLQHLPRAGDYILLSDNTKYKVKEVLHLLPLIKSDIQKIYIVLE